MLLRIWPQFAYAKTSINSLKADSIHRGLGSVRAPDGRWSLVRQSVFSIADDFTAGMANAVGNDLQIRMLPRITS